MKIGIDASRANLLQKTGTELYAYTVIEELKKIAQPEDRFILYSKEALRGGLERLPGNFSSQVLRWPPGVLWTQLRLSINQMRQRPDVLFVPAHTLPLIAGEKTVLTLHDIGFERLAHLYSPDEIGPKGWAKKLLSAMVRLATGGRYQANELDYHRWSTRWALRHADAIIVPSQFTKDEIVEVFGADPDIITVIYHGVDYERFRPADASQSAAVLRRYGITDPYFLFIGRLEAKKNTAGLVEAFAILKHAYKLPHKLVLAGKPGFGYEKVRNAILKHNLSKEIIFPGYVDSADTAALYSAASVFLFPTLYEGFGLPVLEAMACDTPVVASNLASLPEISGTAAQLVDPYDPDEIASAVARVASTPNLRETMRHRGREQVRRFRWSEAAKKTYQLIRDIAA
ncbi:MAG: glycosyltransferase family 1 protein [bacterium]|nr:glycosyltransferase family 1 protein [bacterium]